MPYVLILQKAIGQLAMPMGLLWLGLMATLGLCWRHRRCRIALAVLVAALTLLGNEWVGSRAMHGLEAPYAGTDPLAATAPYDVVFVLGGGTSQTPDGEPELGNYGDRIRLAAALYHAGLAERLVLSGSGIPGYSGTRDYGADAREILVQLGVPAEIMSTLPGPRNTSEEIRAYAELAAPNHWPRAGLVTSAWHLRRAMALARTHELHVEPLPADFRGGDAGFALIDLIPTADGLADTTRAAWEYLGWLVGR